MSPHLISSIFTQLGEFHPVVGEVMDHENKGAHAMHLVAPAESKKGEGGEMVDEHLPEVFSLYVKKLKDGERPIERQLKQYF